MFRDVGHDRVDQFRNIVKDTATDSLVRDLPEPPFHQVQP